MRIASPTARSAAGRGPGISRPSRWQLGEVDAGDEAEEEPDHRDDEEPDHAQDAPATRVRLGTPGLQVAARHGVLHDGAQQRGPRSRPQRRSSRCRCRPARPDDERRRPISRLPGRTGTRIPTRPTSDGQAGDDVDGLHGVRLSERSGTTNEAPAIAGASSMGRGCSVGRRADRRVDELAGLVVHVHGDLAELVAVLAGVVGAEQQLTAARELDAEVGLGAASVASVTAVRGLGATAVVTAAFLLSYSWTSSGHFATVSVRFGESHLRSTIQTRRSASPTAYLRAMRSGCRCSHHEDGSRCDRWMVSPSVTPDRKPDDVERPGESLWGRASHRGPDRLMTSS